MNSIDEVLVLAGQGKWVLFSAVLIGAVVRVLKSGAVLPAVPTPWRPWLALGLGAVAGVIQAMAAGTPWSKALLDGLIAALTAMGGHDLLIGSLRGGREIGSATAPAQPSQLGSAGGAS